MIWLTFERHKSAFCVLKSQECLFQGMMFEQMVPDERRGNVSYTNFYGNVCSSSNENLP